MIAAELRKVVRAYLDAREASVVRMLGAWVSEIEPEIIYGPGFELLGLGHCGRVVIPFRMEA